MIRAAILCLVLIMAGVSSAYAGECGKLCDKRWWEAATYEEIASDIATVDVNARNVWGSTPLHFADRHGSPNSVAALLKAGADVSARSKTGSTPLHDAAYDGTPAKITILLRAGANLKARNILGETPLHEAARSRNTGNIRVLLHEGANVMAQDKSGYTPLHHAAMSPIAPPANISVLISAGADVSADDGGGWTALHVAYTATSVRALIIAGAEVNALDAAGNSPLHYNAHHGAPDAVTALLDAGADAKIKSSKGLEPFYLAKDNEELKGTDAYWRLHDALYD